MEEDTKVVYCRHQFSKRPNLLKKLWKRRWIAIHFEDKPTADPDAYGPKGRNALRRLKKYCETGVIVAADFHIIQPSSMLIGLIPAGSPIKLWRHVEPGSDTHIYKIYKVVSLKKARKVSFVSHPLLAAIQPQQGTIMRWRMAEEYVKAIFHRRPLPCNVQSLTAGQLEVICYEYLRGRGDIDALLLPIGRSLLNVDIVGIDRNGRTVFAQVTQAPDESQVADKVARLRNYEDPKTRLLFFGPTKPATIDDGSILHVPLDQVFDELRRDPGSTTYKMLERMLNPGG